MSYEGLVLDFDGVMADTLGAHTAARLEAFAAYGYNVDPALHEEGHKHGSHPNEIIGWILKAAGIVAADADVLTDPTVVKVVTRKSELYFEHAASGLEPVEGSFEFIDWAHSVFGTGRLAVSTTATICHEVNPFIDRHGLNDHFAVLVGDEDTPRGRKKPDPFVYLEAAQRLGVPSDRLLAIEDTPKGIESAHGAGYRVAGLTTTHHPSELAEAELVSPSFNAIQQYLSRRDRIILRSS